jgi:hypothetical protein
MMGSGRFTPSQKRVDAHPPPTVILSEAPAGSIP